MTGQPKRICVVNIVPVADAYSAASLDTVEACCRGALERDTALTFRSPRRGPEPRSDTMEDHRNPYFLHLVTHEAIETILRADREGFDAIVVNCFDDPGVKEARSLTRTLVLGLSEPTFFLACQLGRKLGALVPDMPGQVAFVSRQIEEMGLWPRMITNGVRAERKRFTESFPAALTEPRTMIDRLSAQAREMVDEGADVIVIACGGLGQICGVAGFHALEHKGRLVPVVNPLTVAVKAAETMIALHRGLGMPIPSQTEGGKFGSAEDLVRWRTGFGVEG